MRNLALNEALRSRIVVCGAIPAVIHLCREHSDPQVQEACAATLSSLAASPAHRPALASLGTLPVLVSLLTTSRHDSTIEHTAAAVGNLAEDAALRCGCALR